MYDTIIVGARCAGSPTEPPSRNRLAAHEAARNERVRPMYEFTSLLAALEPASPEMRALFGALNGNQAATDALLSAITGTIPLPDFLPTRRSAASWLPRETWRFTNERRSEREE
jgi:hypothetical protein